MDRKVVLDGEKNIIQMCNESNLQIFSGTELVKKGCLLDELHKRLYVISRMSPRAIIVREEVIGPESYGSPVPLDHPRAVGNLIENNPRILVKRSI